MIKQQQNKVKAIVPVLFKNREKRMTFRVRLETII